MAANSKQKLKLLYLYQMLDEKTDSAHGLSMSQILQNLADVGVNAERKGIYRDLDVLREFGCTITTLQRMPVEYTMEKSGLNLDDLTLLVDAVQSSKFITQQTADRLVSKLSALASTYQRSALKGRVHVDGRVKSQSESVFFNVNAIHEAMREKRKVSFLYYKLDVHFERQIQHDGAPYVLTPVQVVFSDGYYYLVAWSDKHDDFVRFRIDRMRLVQVHNEPAVRNEQIANYDLADFAFQSFGFFDGEITRAKLRVKPGAMDVVADRFGTDVRVKDLKDGSAEVGVTVRKSAPFFGWVAGMNGAVTISGPKPLAKEYRSWLKGLLKKN